MMELKCPLSTHSGHLRTVPFNWEREDGIVCAKKFQRSSDADQYPRLVEDALYWLAVHVEGNAVQKAHDHSFS